MAAFRITKPYTMSKEEVRETAEGWLQVSSASTVCAHAGRGDAVRIRGAGVDGKNVIS